MTASVLAAANRGIVLDLVVFLVNAVSVRVLVSVGQDVIHAAQEDARAKFAVGLFFAGLVLLQPVGPWLKRWAFHQRASFDLESGAGCLLFYFMFFYYVLVLALATAATILISQLALNDSAKAALSVLGGLGGFVCSILTVIVVYRYFMTPKRPPRWAFLKTPAAERVGDVCMYTNVIGLQIIWGSVTASPMFREDVTGMPLGRPGSFTDMVGRLIAISILALVVYVPGRIFYLAEDKHRKLTWLTMLLANLPLILRTVFASPGRP